MTFNGTSIDRIYGRQGSAGGILCVDDKLYVFSAADFNKLTQEEYDSKLIGKELDAIVLVTGDKWDLSSSQLKNITYEIAGGVDVTLTIPQNAGWTYRFDGDGYTGYAKMLNSNQVANGYFEVETADGFLNVNNEYEAIHKKLKSFMPNKTGCTFIINDDEDYVYYDWNVKLIADLDFNNKEINTIHFMYDSLDGQNHTIKNANIVSPFENSCGFLNAIENISNVSFDNIHVECNIEIDKTCVGVAVGNLHGGVNVTAAQNVTVSNSSITIRGNAKGCYVGGIAGFVTDADIKNCSVENVTIQGGKRVGSILGMITADNAASRAIEISANKASNVEITTSEKEFVANAFSGRLLAAGGSIKVSGTTISDIAVNSVVYGQDDLDNVVLPVLNKTNTPYGQLYLQDSGSITIDGESAFSSVTKPTT